MWFYAALRYWGRKTPVANSFYDDGSQYITESAFLAPNPRLTWQATPKNKLVWQIERSGPMTGPRMKTPVVYPAIILPGQRGNMPFSFEAPGKWKFDANLSKRFKLT